MEDVARARWQDARCRRCGGAIRQRQDWGKQVFCAACRTIAQGPSPEQKRRVVKRASGRCARCAGEASGVVKEDARGSNLATNLVAACRRCAHRWEPDGPRFHYPLEDPAPNRQRSAGAATKRSP